MNDLVIGICALIATGIAIWATIAAVRTIRSGESPWKAIKTWFIRVIDALFGLG